jgi:two-component sensor histidine kinase
VGLPDELDISAANTLGLQMVCMLAEQLGGEIQWRRHPGTGFTMAFQEISSREGR